MPRSSSSCVFGLVLLGALFAGSGCTPFIATPAAPPRYVEPAPEAPHAMVQVATKYENEPGKLLDQAIGIDGRVMATSEGARAQRTSAIRVSPGATRWAFVSRFYHLEERSHLELVLRTEYEWSYCAYRDSKGDCQSGQVLVTRSRLENVWRTEEIVDATCDASSSYTLAVEHSYRVSYTFISKNDCKVSCLDVTDGGAGVPCASPPPPAPTVAASSSPPLPKNEKVETKSPPPTTVERPLAPFGATAIVIGSLGLVTSAGAGYFALLKKEEVAKHCTPSQTCDAKGLAAAEDGGKAVTVATTAFGVGSAVLVGGIALLVFGPSKTVTQPSVAVSRDGAQLGIGGKF